MSLSWFSLGSLLMPPDYGRRGAASPENGKAVVQEMAFVLESWELLMGELAFILQGYY